MRLPFDDIVLGGCSRQIIHRRWYHDPRTGLVGDIVRCGQSRELESRKKNLFFRTRIIVS